MSDLTKVMLAFLVIATCANAPEVRAVGWAVVIVGVVIHVTSWLAVTVAGALT